MQPGAAVISTQIALPDGERICFDKVDPFVKTGGRAVVRATLLLFLSLRCLFYDSLIACAVEYTSAGVR
jgi:hypothetical protein